MTFNGDRVLSTPTRPTVVIQAFCHSERCTFGTTMVGERGQARYAIHPKSKPGARGAWCPDCGHALVWKRKEVKPEPKEKEQ